MLDLQVQLNILYIIISILILYNLYRKLYRKEHFSSSSQPYISNEDSINILYQADLKLIRSLSRAASELEKGKCNSDLKVINNLICNTNTSINGNITTNNLKVNSDLIVPNITNGKVTTNNLTINNGIIIGDDMNINSPYITFGDVITEQFSVLRGALAEQTAPTASSSLYICGQGTELNRKITMFDNVQINGNLDISGTITTDIINKQSISGNFKFTNSRTGEFTVPSNPFFTKANADGIIFTVTGLYIITLIIIVDNSSKYSDCSKNTKGRLINSDILINGIICNINSYITGDNGHNINTYLYLDQPFSITREGYVPNTSFSGYNVEIKIAENCTFYPAKMVMTFLCYAQKNMKFSPTFLNPNFFLNTTATYTISYL
jgi:cytoskeletal protein CcmA (bactofilin family)